jgi:hypothetical protein
MTLFSLRRGISRLAIALGLAGLNAFAGTINVQWINTVGNPVWSIAANWSGGVVPNNSGGNSYSVTLPAGAAVSLYDISPVISSLVVEDNAELFNESFTCPIYCTFGQTLTTGSLDNAGFIWVAYAGNRLNVSGNLNNTGQMRIGSGSLNVTVGGVLSNAGALDADVAQFSAQHYIQTGAGSHTQIFNGSTMSVADAVVSGGIFALADSTMNGNLSMEGGTFDTYVPFCLNCSSILNGNFSISSSSTYVENIFVKRTPANLAVSGDADLAGTLNLSFFSCNSFGSGCVNFPDGTTINLMSYAAETGQFNSFQWGGLFPNQTVSLNYGPHELDAVIHGRPLPEPASWLLMGTGIVALLLFSGRGLAISRPGNRERLFRPVYEYPAPMSFRVEGR